MKTIIKIIMTLLAIIGLAFVVTAPLIPVTTITYINTTTYTNITENVTITPENVTNESINYTIHYNEDHPYPELFIPKDALIGVPIDGLTCERIAKAFQKVYGGALVFVAPYDTITGKYMIGEYTGHIFNRIYYDNKTIFVSYQTKEVYYTRASARSDMAIKYSQKYDNVDVKLFIIGEDTMPYPIHWHY